MLPRLDSDLLDIFVAVTENRLADVDISWKEDKAVCVVAASGGYPGGYEKNKVIGGLDRVDEDVIVFHAGTARKDTAQLGCAIPGKGRLPGRASYGDGNVRRQGPGSYRSSDSTHEEARSQSL